MTAVDLLYQKPRTKSLVGVFSSSIHCLTGDKAIIPKEARRLQLGAYTKFLVINFFILRPISKKHKD